MKCASLGTCANLFHRTALERDSHHKRSASAKKPKPTDGNEDSDRDMDDLESIAVPSDDRTETEITDLSWDPSVVGPGDHGGGGGGSVGHPDLCDEMGIPSDDIDRSAISKLDDETRKLIEMASLPGVEYEKGPNYGKVFGHEDRASIISYFRSLF